MFQQSTRDLIHSPYFPGMLSQGELGELHYVRKAEVKEYGDKIPT
jgi:hypothetical protein